MPEVPSNGTESMKRGSLADREWMVAIAAIIVAAMLFAFGRGSLPKQGQTTTYAITVVPADARHLACASSTPMGERRCGFDSRQQPVNIGRPLRPFVTTGRELLLLSGVFESSSVAAWLAAAQQSGDPARVTLNCNARILGTMETASVRWATDGEFQPERSVIAADVEDCLVQR